MVILRAGLVPGRRPFAFSCRFFWRTRAEVVGRLGVGGKVTAAGFPGPRGGPVFRRAEAGIESSPVDVRAKTEERLRDS